MDHPGRSLFRIKVQARSPRPGIERLGADELRLRVSAAPVKGAANREVVRLIADFFAVPVSSVEIVKGKTSSRKLVAVTFPAS